MESDITHPRMTLNQQEQQFIRYAAWRTWDIRRLCIHSSPACNDTFPRVAWNHGISRISSLVNSQMTLYQHKQHFVLYDACVHEIPIGSALHAFFHGVQQYFSSDGLALAWNHGISRIKSLVNSHMTLRQHKKPSVPYDACVHEIPIDSALILPSRATILLLGQFGFGMNHLSDRHILDGLHMVPLSKKKGMIQLRQLKRS